MAVANIKSLFRKRKQQAPKTVLQMILRSTPDKPKRGWPYLPWTAVIDAHVELFGFEPGDRIYLENKTSQIHITPDYGDLDFHEQPYHQTIGTDPFARQIARAALCHPHSLARWPVRKVFMRRFRARRAVQFLTLIVNNRHNDSQQIHGPNLL
ncbi:hypothetical protein [Burkholderia ambifaria]|uniref:hypothetical protein n=1 Tax=Burkholderia ambifaria TaxID=152480 RepID=UPI001FC7C0AF|nr:hypothetical protein [Burkholderia ambifaria]